VLALWPMAYGLWPMTSGLASFSAKQRSSEAAKQRSSEAAKQRSSEAAKQRSSKAAKQAACSHWWEELNGYALVGDKAGLARRPYLG